MYANRIAALITGLGAALAWLVATLAVAESTSWPLAVIVSLTFVFGLLVGVVSRAIASGPTRSWPGVAGRVAVGGAIGVVVGELAAVVLFSGTIDRRLDAQAAVRADAAPAVAQASADLARSREARAGLDRAVERALRLRDEALVVARCEYNPSPACPQTHITGVPGSGPENRRASEFLADAERELDTAVAERDRRADELDAWIADGEQALAQAREAATADVDRGLGARWAAMYEDTLSSPAALLLRLPTTGFFALLFLLPLILKLWRGETTDERSAAARANQDRAELEADTAIAVKRAEVRAAVETMWAEQQLASARLAVEAQTEIDREHQRRRVIEAVGGPVPVQAQRVDEPAAQLPAGEKSPENLPAQVESGSAVEPRREGGNPLLPTIPDVTKVAGRWIRPFVPPIIASAVETVTKPLRGVRQVFEEEEEIHFSLKRSRKVTVHSEDRGEQVEPRTTTSTVLSERRDAIDADTESPSLGSAEGEQRDELTAWDRPHELCGPDGPRQLPPAE
jgi:hypothetical protein